MSLLDLPAEVLQLVVEATLPDEFEDFAVTCKQIYHASEKRVPKHNALRRRYRHFEFDGVEDVGDTIICSLQLLHEISKEPLIARYIRYADLKNDSAFYFNDDGSYRGSAEQLKAAIEASGGVRRLLEESTYLKDAQQDPEVWYENMRDDPRCGELALGLLLSLLPQVRELTLPGRMEEFTWSEDTSGTSVVSSSGQSVSALLAVIQRRANENRDGSASLSKLATIKPGRGTGGENRSALQMFAPVLAITSVREFYAGSCIARDDGYTGFPFHPVYETLGKGLEIIELAGACIDSREIAKLLSSTSRLKTFNFSYEVKWHGCGYDWDAGAFVAAVEDKVGATLENLSISILSCYGKIGTGVVSMTGFERLRHLEFDTALLLGPAYSGLPDQSMDIFDSDPDGEVAIPRLVDLLPSSVETLRLLTTDTSSNPTGKFRAVFKRLFDGMEHGKAEELPNLSKIAVHHARTTGWTKYRASITNELVVSEPIERLGEDSVATFQSTFNSRFGVETYN